MISDTNIMILILMTMAYIFEGKILPSIILVVVNFSYISSVQLTEANAVSIFILVAIMLYTIALILVNKPQTESD